ncbi:2-oxoacid:ferredoxin oxidoreductase subunit beta [Candidatus Formimonas warabiya]|uniref:2-oxoglutarate ferredoxin oxidoreductase subunit beta n=1 Tax=Formimonas warabiya TaxID=1761012 RepID=A0A3G1KXR1_FORW1|nr:2-oxoacid:ferredoxin oxidoreductase subunit beta [Candidatus Formimonas warabiya]ATW27187.1 2-oxoglutarate ferredoxin oxidoreductase subunit beta [Candidatus Formimonas warabiya]
MQQAYEKYFRQDRLPHIWCPGCGNGVVLGAFARAMAELNIDQNQTVVISGIGCSSRATTYLDFNTLHTTHGRALAFATGVKLSEPRLNVFVFMGDGDSSAIGGNHLIHACRRNIDITAVIINNNIYGMTGGQYSPLTPTGKKATTAPYGMIERNFDLCELVKGAGATYVARGTTYHAKQLTDLIVAGAKHKGFSLIEAVSQCPVSYGRRNKMKNALEMVNWAKEHAVNQKAAEKMTPAELEGKFLIGELHQSAAPEYTAEYDKLIAKLQGGIA